MDSTPVSLLQQLRADQSPDSWQRFVALYVPILLDWSRRLGLQEADAADLVQEVFLILRRKLPNFAYDPAKASFRGWLRTVLVNKWRATQRHAVPLTNDLTAPSVAQESADPLEAISEAEYRQQLVRRALRLMQSDFQPKTWLACWATVVEGRRPAEVAADLNLSPRAVHLARARVLRRLREELSGLID